MDHLWAPWRMEYIEHNLKGNSDDDCIFCTRLEAADDDKHLILHRGDNAFIIMNLFPYNNGHLLIAPIRHIPDLTGASDEELLEMTKLIRESQRALSLAIKPHGFNVGMNFGRCGGAGLPGHLHLHVVPRWDGDTNFMHVCSDTDVISQSLTELLGLLKQVSKEQNLPNL